MITNLWNFVRDRNNQVIRVDYTMDFIVHALNRVGISERPTELVVIPIEEKRWERIRAVVQAADSWDDSLIGVQFFDEYTEELRRAIGELMPYDLEEY